MRLYTKKADANREYGGLRPWLQAKLDLPEDVDIRVKDCGMYSNYNIIFTFPSGEKIECGAYFGFGSSRYYKVTVNNKQRERMKELVEEMAA